MNKPITITGTVRAWMTSTRTNLDAILSGSEQDAISALGFSCHDMDKGSYPWTHIGSAEVTVTLMPRTEMVASQVETLNAELQQERAASAVRQNAILDRISKLQALTFEGVYA